MLLCALFSQWKQLNPFQIWIWFFWSRKTVELATLAGSTGIQCARRPHSPCAAWMNRPLQLRSCWAMKGTNPTEPLGCLEATAKCFLASLLSNPASAPVLVIQVSCVNMLTRGEVKGMAHQVTVRATVSKMLFSIMEQISLRELGLNIGTFRSLQTKANKHTIWPLRYVCIITFQLE